MNSPYSRRFTLGSAYEQLFDTVLFMAKMVCQPGTEPVVGGGAVRDVLLCKPIKDIDVFVPAGSIAEDLGAYQGLFPGIHEMGEGMIEYLEVRDLKRIVSLGQCGAFEVQLIEYDATKPLLETFDIGLCRVSYGPQHDGFLRLCNSLNVSEEFAFDQLNKRLTVIRPNGHERTGKRLRRLLDKYPEFTPVWPDGGYHLPGEKGLFIE